MESFERARNDGVNKIMKFYFAISFDLLVCCKKKIILCVCVWSILSNYFT